MSQRTAVIDSSVIEAAIRDALRSRGLSLGAFPPADPKRRATSVLESALSKELQDSGLVAMTTETLLSQALDNVEAWLGNDALSAFRKVEEALWEQLASAIDDTAIDEDEADLTSPLGRWTAEAVRVLDADVLVTMDRAHLDLSADEHLVILSPGSWLALPDSEIRKHRSR